MRKKRQLEIYKRNLLILLDGLIESCKSPLLDEQVKAFNTVKNLIEKDVIADKDY